MPRPFDRRTLVAAGAAGLTLALAGAPFRSARAAEPVWRMLSDGDGPPARWDHTLVADDESKQLILFGGRDAGFSALGDTWIYSLPERAWRQVEGPGPEPRFGQAVAVDQAAHRMILFGGETASVFYNDTWVFDVANETWSRVDTGDSPLPSPRYGLGAVLDGEGRLIISHGFTFEGRFDDTWSLDLTTGLWTDVSPDEGGVRPLKRCLHEQVWDDESGMMLLYGGCSSGFGPCPRGDLWSFDPANRAWVERTPADGPAGRSNPAMVLDMRNSRVLLIGGLTGAGATADLWEGTADGDSFAWTELSAGGEAPAPRSSHDAVLTRGDVYLFGGTGAAVFADLWKLSLT